MTAAAPPTRSSVTDESACATPGDDGVESRLGDVYDGEAASRELVAEYRGAPVFQQALEDALELLRSSGGELEGDVLAAACGG